ncbi:MAG: hypothetical protein J1F07_09590 [Muribaculaceae bacterium]|nr:hypothetical protein [Muribaculaceae bacterium]
MIKKFRLALVGMALLSGAGAFANNEYGIPEDITDANVLHCFDWKLLDIKKALPEIAEAGFGAVQISPVQYQAMAGYIWADLYLPYDFAFRQNGLGTQGNLQSLCEEAEKYGIKIIVDVVFNHINNNTYHDPWWNSNGRMRSTTSMINYSNRYSITHDRLGNYPEVNSEDPEVTARAKSYIEQLKDLGVKGIRFDAAKHIALPSEGTDFWKEVTSVPGMFYYGEILSTPGGSNANDLMKEYTTYMSVTDDTYGTNARTSAGVPVSNGNWVNKGIDGSKIVYWGESHDTYANAGGASKNVSQGVIDRAYAIVACRDKEIALYFSRPSQKEYGDIKVGQKGSTHFTEPVVAEVNKFKNAMVGKADYYSQNGSTASVTRKDGGAVIVNKMGAGDVKVPNGNSYCPVGTYIDHISGNTFTVTADFITGKVGDTGVAVLYDEPEGEDPGNDAAIGEVEAENFDIESAAWYTLQGVRVSPTTERGVYILVAPNGKTKKILI